MSRGINVAENLSKSTYSFNNKIRKPIVFLSHKSEDKEFVETIGDYFKNAGVNIYLDTDDFKLHTAVKSNDPKAITECIQKGISDSDYILCFASKKTITSWWVPYEIGYGKKAEKEIATLIRNDVEYIPDFLQIEEILDDISGVNRFIKRITSKFNLSLTEKYDWQFASNDYIEKSTNSNPLSKYLKVK